MKRLNKKFIVSRISELPTVPISWAFKNINQQNVFTLDVRMCELNDFKNQCSFLFDGLKFQSDTTLTQDGGSTSQINLLNLETKIFSRSDLILKLDLSLNNITVLKIQDLEPFSQLRRLDASLNRIDSFTGIMSCSQLTHLCLAYNNIRDIPWKSLEECPHLNNIDFCSNQITTLKGFPVLLNLQTLKVGSNFLKNLDGLHLLRNMREIHANSNQIDNIIGISSCHNMSYVNLSNNKISGVVDIIEVFCDLKQVQRLDIEKNPVLLSSKKELHDQLVKQTSVKILNRTNILPLTENYLDFSGIEPPTSAESKKEKLKSAVRDAMERNLFQKQTENDAYIYYLYNKILSLRNDMDQFISKVEYDSSAWCGYIDTLTTEEAQALTVGRMETLMQHSTGIRSVAKQDDKPKESVRKQKYLQVRNPTELLLAASKELSDLNKD